MTRLLHNGLLQGLRAKSFASDKCKIQIGGEEPAYDTQSKQGHHHARRVERHVKAETRLECQGWGAEVSAAPDFDNHLTIRHQHLSENSALDLIFTMPSRTLPNFQSKEVATNKTSNSCWVTIGSKVYDVTDFLDAHPGGGDLILEYGGKDVGAIMQDEISHTHSESAYDVLDENLIGFVAADPLLKTVVDSDRPQDILPLPPNPDGAQELRDNGVAEHVPTNRACITTSTVSEDALYREPDTADHSRRRGPFLNLNEPLLMQVWNGGFSKDFYLREVHRGFQYKGDGSAPLFGNFLEPLSKTPWWVIPIVWLPWVCLGSWLAYGGIPSAVQFAAYWATGLGLWTLVEYGLHRGLFHIDKCVLIFSSAMTRAYMLYLDICRITELESPRIFFCMASIISYQWTNTG